MDFFPRKKIEEIEFLGTKTFGIKVSKIKVRFK